jgi:hypothetical protein
LLQLYNEGVGPVVGHVAGVAPGSDESATHAAVVLTLCLKEEAAAVFEYGADDGCKDDFVLQQAIVGPAV